MHIKFYSVLCRQRKDAKLKQNVAVTEHKMVTDALGKFIAVLSENQLDEDVGVISRKELELAFKKVYNNVCENNCPDM